MMLLDYSLLLEYLHCTRVLALPASTRVGVLKYQLRVLATTSTCNYANRVLAHTVAATSTVASGPVACSSRRLQ
jgi:hypothetical protein